MTKAHIIVNGFRVSNRSQRRWVAITTREEAHTERDAYGNWNTYVAFAEIAKRSDNLDGLRKIQRSYGRTRTGCYMVIVDTETGEQV